MIIDILARDSRCLLAFALLSVIASLASIPAGLFAQTAPVSKPLADSLAPKPVPVKSTITGPSEITLSPFHVRPEEDEGYLATAMLQGGRGRMSLADVSSPVSVFTAELMRDLASTSFEDLALYSTNTVGYFETSSTADTNPTNVQNHVAGSTNSPGNFNSSRGLGSLNRTRNFFTTLADTDSYNLDRVSIVSGANAVMFGLGNPAGTVESTTARAKFKNASAVRTRFDNYGSSRYLLDVNQVLVAKTLAVRAIGMQERKEYFLRPGYDDADRLFLTSTYKILPKTTLRADVEWMRREVSRSSTISLRDRGFLDWYNRLQAGEKVEYLNRAATFVPTTANPRPLVPFASQAFDTGHGVYNLRRPYTFETNRSLLTFGVIPDDRVGVFDYRNTVRSFPFGGLVFEGTAPADAPTNVRSIAGYPVSINRPDLIPWDVNPAGLERVNRQRFRNQTFTVEQQLANHSFLELAFMSEMFNTKQAGMVTDAYNLAVDVNKFLPDGVINNPMYGRAYIYDATGGAGSLSQSKQQAFRATLTHEIDFRQLPNWLRHLGRHEIGLFGISGRDHSGSLGGLRRTILGNPTFLTDIDPSAQNVPHATSRPLLFRYYLPKIGAPNSPTDPAAYGVSRDPGGADPFGTQTYRYQNGETFKVSQFENPAGYVVGLTQSFISQQKNRALALSTSSSFLSNRLVANVGYRLDKVEVLSLNNNTVRVDTANLDLYPQGLALDPAIPIPLSDYREASRLNYGFVVRPFKNSDVVSLTYENSSNATLSDGRIIIDLHGNPQEDAHGISEDYSLRFKLFNDKLHLRLGYFESFAANAENIGDNPVHFNLINFERNLATADPTFALLDLFTPKERPGRTNQLLERDDFRIPTDRSSQGVEFEVVYNPVPNWRILVNAGRSSTTWNLEKALPDINLIESRQGLYERSLAWNTLYTGSTTATFAQTYESIVGLNLDNLVGSLGPIGDNAQTWRANLITNYSFTAGRLAGLTLGGTVRYRGKTRVGYGLRVEGNDPASPADNILVPDYDKPYFYDAYAIYGAMVGYKVKLFKKSVRFQLNVNNVTDDATVVVAQSNPNGPPRLYGRQPGREWVLSCDWEF